MGDFSYIVNLTSSSENIPKTIDDLNALFARYEAIFHNIFIFIFSNGGLKFKKTFFLFHCFGFVYFSYENVN